MERHKVEQKGGKALLPHKGEERHRSLQEKSSPSGQIGEEGPKGGKKGIPRSVEGKKGGKPIRRIWGGLGDD